jgi:hypothetical protein
MLIATLQRLNVHCAPLRPIRRRHVPQSLSGGVCDPGKIARFDAGSGPSALSRRLGSGDAGDGMIATRLKKWRAQCYFVRDSISKRSLFLSSSRHL